jgi:hypothetical protein
MAAVCNVVKAMPASERKGEAGPPPVPDDAEILDLTSYHLPSLEGINIPPGLKVWWHAMP